MMKVYSSLMKVIPIDSSNVTLKKYNQTVVKGGFHQTITATLAQTVKLDKFPTSQLSHQPTASQPNRPINILQPLLKIKIF